MSAARVDIKVDISDPDRELRRLQDGPDVPDILRLEAVLVTLFQETQRVVHVRTGSLKGSGDVDSQYRGRIWRGEISYGGIAVGFIHNPVQYAEFEQDRGGAHDFMAPVYQADDGYAEAILGFFRGYG